MGKKAEIGFMGFIVILGAVVGLGLFFSFKLGFLEKDYVQEKLYNIKSDKVELSNPPKDYEWCKVQSYQSENYLSNDIIGWDYNKECCVQEIKAFDVCLNKSVVLKRCFVGDVNSINVWSKIDGYRIFPANDYDLFLNPLVENSSISKNFDCNSIVYPAGVEE